MTLIPVYYLLMGCMITCYLMAQPGVDSFSADEKKSLFATSFLMWPLMIIGLIFKKDE